MTQTTEIDFMFEISFNKNLPDFYDEVVELSNKKVLLCSKSGKIPELSNQIHLIYDVPSFLAVKKINFKENFSFKSIIQHKGYCIKLESYNDIETYLQDRFSRSSRQMLGAGKKRLETCFDITYRMYYGAIETGEYSKLFKRFYEMLKLRAHEKGIENRNLKNWGLYTREVYDMILSKKASLFVIYNGNEAINISLNMHVKNIVFGFITTYDIDYSKFRIGHTNLMIQIDWFIKNNIKLVDFSKGNIAYKKRWTNTEYDFDYHIFYEKNSLLLRIKAFWLYNKLRLKQTLRNLNINTYYYNTLGLLKGNHKSKKKSNYKLITQVELPEKSKLKAVLFRTQNEYLLLNRIIYNYLFLSFLHVNDLKVYKELQNDNIFYFQSKKETIKLILL